MSDEKRIPVSMRLKPSFVKQVKEYSKHENRSVTAMFEYAFMEYVRNNKRNWSGSVGTQPDRELTAKASKEPGE